MSDTRSGNNAWLVVLVAFVIVVAAIGAYVYFDQKPPVHAGQVLSLDVYPIHRELNSNGPATEGLQGQSETYDEVLVFADVRVENHTSIPLFLHDMWAILDLPDGLQRSTAASPADFAKVFAAYPDLAHLKKDPLPRSLTLTPGQKVDGLLVFNYQINKAQWDARNGLDIYFSFLHQKPLILHVAKPGAKTSSGKLPDSLP
jgi:hypothetical protein